MPIVKWVGGKRQLLEEISKYTPEKFNVYYEPFFGGGAVLFNFQPKKAIINDLNLDLMTTLKVVKNYPNELLESLEKHENTSEYFYMMRDKDRDSEEYKTLSEVEKASRLIYLNKTCYNGLFRVNSSGQFNTPFGNYRNPNIVNKPVIKAVSGYLNENDITIESEDFEIVLETIQENDFVYLDPPYHPISESSNFTGYIQGGWNIFDQARLREACDELTKRGVKFLLSNSASGFIKDQYRNYNIITVKAIRSINVDTTKRGEVDELLIRNYE